MAEVSKIESPVAGRRVAFIGKLGSMNRREARELVRKHGAVMVDKVDQTVDLIVLGADELPIGDSDTLLDESIVEAAATNRLEIINEAQLLQQLGLVETDLDIAQLYTPAMLADLLQLPIATVRRWHRRGLITPARKINKLAYFDFQEVASARRIARLVASGASAQAIELKLSRLAELYPDLLRPLSQLSVIVEGKNILLRQGEGLIEPGGQMRINFDLTDTVHEPDSPPADAIISIEGAAGQRSIEELSSPDEFIAHAIELEDADDFESAIEVYRALSLAFGPSADVCFRIAELLYHQHDLSGARERYYLAIELDETYVEAYGCLGCLLVELGELDLAHSAFTGALQHHPDYPDAHFHMGRLLDEQGKSDQAARHWGRFLELAPKSPWAVEARDRLQT